MTEALLRLRQPAAVVLLLVVVFRLLLGVVALFWLGQRTGIGVEAGTAAGVVVSPVLCLALAAAVAACGLWRPTPAARTLAAFSGLSIVVAVFVSAGLATVSVLHRQPSRDQPTIALLAWVPELVLCLLASLVCSRVLWNLPAPLPGLVAGPRPEAELPAPAEAPTEQTPADAGTTAPSWQPDEASGAVWRTAGAAASGASATAWGTPGSAGGWAPESAPEEPAPAGAHWDSSRFGRPPAAVGWQIPDPGADVKSPNVSRRSPPDEGDDPSLRSR